MELRQRCSVHDEPDRRDKADLPVQRSFPSLNSEARRTHLKAQLSEGGPDAVVVADILGFGVMKHVVAFKSDRFMPFIAARVIVFRADNAKVVHRMTYMTLTPRVDSPDGELNDALQDGEYLREQYRLLVAQLAEKAVEHLAPVAPEQD
ncbi:MAG: hypothetical protein AAGD32_15125 [Planctomycetota bacterium]